MQIRSFRRFAALLTAAVMASGVFCGCSEKAPAEGEVSASSSAQPNTEPAASESAAETGVVLQHAADSGVISSVEATHILSNGIIGCDTGFTVTLDREMPEAQLSEMLVLSPEVPFNITKQADNIFLVKPSESLPSGKLVRLGQKNGDGDSLYKWAFQTSDTFRVKQTYPADGYEYVNVDTGIEITFNADVDPDDAKNYFQITPSVKGRFESHLSTLYFIPEKPLEENKEYTVTLRSGLPSKDNTILEDDFGYSFKTSKDYGKSYCYTDGCSETYVPGDTAVVEIFCSSDYRNSDFNVDIYRFDDADSYIRSLTSLKNGETVSTEGLAKVYSEVSRLIYEENDTSYYSPNFLLLPDDLEEGWYLADISADTGKNSVSIQRDIQISTVSVFCNSLPGQSQFFINDILSGNAAEGAQTELSTDNKTYSAVTDSDGIALMNVPEDKYDSGILKVTCGGRVFADIFSFSSDTADDPRDKYFMYLFTDRETYLTSDTVRVWGVIRPRTADGAIPDDLSLVFGENNYYSGSDTVLERKNITPGADGTFTAEFSFKNHIESWGSIIALYSGDTKLYTKYINIRDYDKPIYSVSVDAPDYVMIYDDEYIPVDISASYYDGTPAEGLGFELNDNRITEAYPERIVSDENGNAHADIKLESSMYSDINYIYLNAEITGVQDVYSSGEKLIYAFSRDIIVESEWDSENKNLVLNANHVTLDNIPEGYDPVYGEYDIFKGEPADTLITAELIHTYSVKTQTGSHYDYLQKKNVAEYKYTTEYESLGVYTVNTENGKAVLIDLPVNEDDGSYHFELSWKDSKGRETIDNYYIGRYNNYESDSSYRYYTFESDKSEFREDQSLSFALTRSSSSAKENCEGRILFTVHGTEFIDSRIFTDSEFEYAMTRECIPTVNVCGAYFDGRHVYPVHEGYYYYTFDPSERKLSLDISSDKESYLPGDTAEITVKASYEDGKSASGASVLLSVVDEAAFAIGDQNADILGDMYGWQNIPSVKEYYSYIQHSFDFDGGAEKGGGGDEWTVRRDFKDTALFSESTADSSGTAHFSLKLPDNLTTWRVTALAMNYTQGTGTGKSSMVFAGNSRYPVKVSQPVFLTPIMPDSFVNGDDIVLAANLHGADSVSITVSGNGTDKTLSGSSGESLSFGKLPEGEYKALFKAEAEGGRDAAEYTFTVTDTLLEVPVMMVSDLSGLNSSDSLRWPVKISFFNKDYMLYTDVLYKLSEYYGNRTDTQIAAQYAMKEFGFITEEEYYDNRIETGSDGFVRLLDASEGDPLLTARLLAAVPELMNGALCADSFYEILNSEDSSDEEISAAFLGLAALGEPVMIQIRRILAEGDRAFEGLDRLRLIAALAVLGDCRTSAGYLSEYLETAERTRTDEGTQLCIKGEDTLEYTKYALVIAAASGLPEADEMARYIVGTEYVYDTAAPELIYYLRHYSAAPDTEAVFSYNTDSGVETVTLDRHFGTCIGFGEEQFRNADFKTVSGNVRTFMFYRGRVTDINAGNSLNITKRLSSENGEYKPGALVTVNITTSEPYCYVTDIIPSCGRFVDNNRYNCSKQTVTLYTDKDGNAQYMFRIAVSGEFKVESAYACGRDSAWGITDPDTITVKG